MKIISIDRTVLTVSDIQATVNFYESSLGMAAETFGEGRTALKFGAQKINLHQQGVDIIQGRSEERVHKARSFPSILGIPIST